jgi:hypothetical protein
VDRLIGGALVCPMALRWSNLPSASNWQKSVLLDPTLPLDNRKALHNDVGRRARLNRGQGLLWSLLWDDTQDDTQKPPELPVLPRRLAEASVETHVSDYLRGPLALQNRARENGRSTLTLRQEIVVNDRLAQRSAGRAARRPSALAVVDLPADRMRVGGKGSAVVSAEQLSERIQ